MSEKNYPSLTSDVCICGNKKTYHCEYDEFSDNVLEMFCESCMIKKFQLMMEKPVEITPTKYSPDCLYCVDGKKMPGMSWCAACAIKKNESLRNTLNENNVSYDENLINNRIALYRRYL